MSEEQQTYESSFPSPDDPLASRVDDHQDTPPPVLSTEQLETVEILRSAQEVARPSQMLEFESPSAGGERAGVVSFLGEIITIASPPNPVEQGVRHSAPAFETFRYPSKLERHIKRYNEAVETFFDMGSSHRRKPDTNNLAQQREYLQRLEAEDVEEGAEGSFDIETLRSTYQRVCEAVSEFELSASTLRSNSNAMTLSKKLAMQSAADIFIVLRDLRPRTRPEITIHAGQRNRMAKWARTMKGEHERGDPWRAINQQLESLSMISEDEDEEREREQSQKSEDEKEMPFRLRYDQWRVPDRWRDVDLEREYIRFQDDKKRDDTKARMQLRELGIIDAGESTGSKEGASGKWLENVYTDSWGDGWLKRAEAEYYWMEKDHTEHPGEWTEDWPRMSLWWNDVREWAERWRWRNDVVEEFEKTIESLLLELEKIDGSVSARELNVFEKSYDDEWDRRLVNHADNMKIALLAGDKGRFAFNYNSALDLIGGVLRSKGVKQGLDALIKKQDHFRNSFMDFATVAIFFSSITATTLQFSFQSGDSTISSTILYYGIRHEDPPPVWDQLWGGFRTLLKALYDVFQPLENWMKVQEIVGPHWEALTRFFASTFSGSWRRLKKFVWKPAPMAPAPAPDDTGHQSIGMGSVRGGTPPIGEASNS
ncbi:hypothetical protein SCHPADRAFT_946268 [Schizopora paradoxa]|uniref:Uncharacterized protein n=1 Tax=Schizopora paradoxa TaxID=27342 RepID=A0A0H2R364_9AGAM|nr:hypothetical protein SCHPADRAFT_946268 [Schizopora paradoxa]